MGVFSKIGDGFKKLTPKNKPKKKAVGSLVGVGLVVLDEAYGWELGSTLMQVIAEAVAQAAG